MKRRWSLLFVGLVFCWCADTQAGASAHYTVNSDKSKLPISVCKEGLFKLFGPDHLVSADIISGHGAFQGENVRKFLHRPRGQYKFTRCNRSQINRT